MRIHRIRNPRLALERADIRCPAFQMLVFNCWALKTLTVIQLA